MKRGFIIILFIISFLIQSCTNNNSDSEFIIKGNFSNAVNEKVILEKLGVRDLSPIDSAYIDESGSFTLRHTPEGIGLYIMRIGRDNFITLLIDKNEKVEVNADASIMAYSYTVNGSEGSGLLKEYYTHTARNKMKVDSLGDIFNSSKESFDFPNIRMKLDYEYRLIFKDQQNFIMDFISHNPSSLASLIVLNKRFGNGYVLSKNDHFEYFQRLDSGLMSTYPNNSHAIAHHKRVTDIVRETTERDLADEKLQAGMPAPDMSVPDTNGTPISLSSGTGRKLRLLYFWAAESALCRQINPELKQLYDKYNSEGLEIYGVSLDRNPNLWKAAIKLDGLKWIQLSDQKGYASPIKKLYNLPEELPFFYLIDKESLILLRGNKHELLVIKEKIETELR